jgi:hypothetical protein
MYTNLFNAQTIPWYEYSYDSPFHVRIRLLGGKGGDRGKGGEMTQTLYAHINKGIGLLEDSVIAQVIIHPVTEGTKISTNICTSYLP